MGRRRRRRIGEDESTRSLTLPSSPSHSHSFSSSSSSDFEFTISISPRKSSSNLCPADELFYKGQLLPLHLSPRISMVRTLLLSSSSTSSSSDTTTTASRDSTGSSNSSLSSDLGQLPECDSSRPSSVTEEDELKRKKPKYFSLARFSSVFRKNRDQETTPASASSVKEVIRKYLKKVKPLYEKLSQKQKMTTIATYGTVGKDRETIAVSSTRKDNNGGRGSVIPHSFSGNLSLRYPRKRNYISSCPSSMRSSPSHSGVLCRNAVLKGSDIGAMNHPDSSSMEELQNAIQGAIAHCKNSMAQNKTFVLQRATDHKMHNGHVYQDRDGLLPARAAPCCLCARCGPCSVARASLESGSRTRPTLSSQATPCCQNCPVTSLESGSRTRPTLSNQATPCCQNCPATLYPNTVCHLMIT